jgi:RNA polymerase sigma-70 factor (ECF subfamily)
MISESEFVKIVNQTKKIVLAAISRNLSKDNYDLVDDIAQETYIRAYKSLVKNKFESEAALNSWLYTIAKNETLRMNKKIYKDSLKHVKSMELFKNELNRDLDGEDQKIIDKIYIEKMLKKLPIKYQNVFQLAYLGYREKEIALKLAIPKGTVKSRLSRGREILYKLIKEGENV